MPFKGTKLDDNEDEDAYFRTLAVTKKNSSLFIRTIPILGTFKQTFQLLFTTVKKFRVRLKNLFR